MGNLQSLCICTLFLLNGCGFAQMELHNATGHKVDRMTAPREARSFRVLDAETLSPIADAKVTAGHKFDYFDTWAWSATTDENGFAKIKIAKNYMHAFWCNARASNYMLGEHVARRSTTAPADQADFTIYLYKLPAPVMGLVVPADFQGVVHYRTGNAKAVTGQRPEFPAGQRIWWTPLAPPVTVVEPPPTFTSVSGWNGQPLAKIQRGSDQIKVANAGDVADGIAVFPIGTLYPDGPWGVTIHVLFVGTRSDALQCARSEHERHENGDEGYIFDGWLRELAPDMVQGESVHPMSVSRQKLR